MSDIVFDPSQPFDVVEDNHPSAGTGFDPTKPFSVRNDSPAQTEERQKMARDLEKLQAEKVSDQFSGFEKFIARAGAGVQKAGINAGRMLTAANDVLFLPEITGLFSQRAGDAYRQAVDRDLAYWNKREEDTTRAIQQIDDNSVLGQIVEGTARAIPEMIPQIIPGMAARTAAGAVKASAITGGVYGGMTQYGQERGEGRSQMEALPYAVTSGLITALTTKAFGATGVESVFKKDGVQGIGAKLLNVLKEAGMEGAEEAVDQFQQDLLERAQRNPEKPIGDSIKDVLMAGTIGSLVGGLASGAHTALTAESKPSDFEKALQEGFDAARGDVDRLNAVAGKAARGFNEEQQRNRIRARLAGQVIPDEPPAAPAGKGQRAVNAAAFFNQPEQTMGEAADEAQARQENESLVNLIMEGRANENPPSTETQNQVEAPSPIPVVESKPAVEPPKEQAQAGTPQPQGGGGITAESIFARNRGETPPDDIASLSDSEAARLFTEKADGGAPKYSPQVDSTVWGAAQSEDKLRELQFLEQAAQARANEIQAETLKLLRANQPIPPELNAAFLAASGKALWYRGAIEGVKKSGPNYQEALQRGLVKPKETPVPPVAANQPAAPVAPVQQPQQPVQPPAAPVQQPVQQPGTKVKRVIATGKPNGSRAEVEYEIVEANEVRQSVVREINELQTRQRSGNVSSDEQIAQIATNPDDIFLFDSPVSTVGAPIIDGEDTIAGNGRLAGLIAGYDGGTRGSINYRRALIEKAKELGIGDISNMVMPVLIRRIKRYTKGDRESFVIESNPQTQALKESVSEAALLDANALGDLSNIEFNESGSLSAAGIAEVARRFQAAQRALTRTTGGTFDANEANKRVQLAALAKIAKAENIPVGDFIGLLESDDGKRVIGEVTKASPRMSSLDQDLQIGGDIIKALRELHSGINAVSSKAFKSLEEWNAERKNQLIKTELGQVGDAILKLMVGSQRSGSVLREFFNEYIRQAEYEQTQRKEAGASADIFGEQRQPVTAQKIAGRILGVPEAGAKDSPVSGAKPNPEVRPEVVAETPPQEPAQPDQIPPHPALPKSESEVRPGKNIFSEFTARLEDWRKAVAEWLKLKPENKAIIWEQPEIEVNGKKIKGNIRALTRNIGDANNPWRVTAYGERDGAYMPMGHQVYPTREKAMTEEFRSGTFHDKFPGRVMDEQEIQGYKLMRDIPDKSKLVWYDLDSRTTVGELKERIRWTVNIQRLVRDSFQNGKVAFTEPLDAGTGNLDEYLARLGLKISESPKPETPKEWAAGSKVQIKAEGPTLWTILEETTDPKFPDERIFKIQNDKTGKSGEYDMASLKLAKARTAEERESTKEKTKEELQNELLKLNPALRNSIKEFKTKAQLRDQIKREKSKRGPVADLGEGLPEGTGWDVDGVIAAVEGEDLAGFKLNVITREQAIELTGRDEAGGYSGFFYNGEVYLVADNIRAGNSEFAKQTLREEVAHGLLRTEDGLSLLRQVLNEGKLRLTKAERDALLAQGYKNEGNQLLDEFIAKSARENTKWWQDVVLAIKAFLARAGLKLSNEDAARILLKQIRSKQPTPAENQIEAAIPASGSDSLSAEEIKRINRELNKLNAKTTKMAQDTARIAELEAQLGQQDLFAAPVVERAGVNQQQREEIARRQGRRLIASQIEDQGGLFAPRGEEKQGDMFAAPPAPKTDTPPKRIETGRAQPMDLFGDLAPSGADNPEFIRAQVGGVRGVGQVREVENIAEIRAAVKERVFNATPAVTDERTEDAWRIANELTDEVTKAGHALRYRNEIGGQEMGLPLLQNELFRYGFKLASSGDETFLRFMLDSSADFQTITGGGRTTSGRVQRAARELADSVAFHWLREAMDTERRNAAISGARILPQETFLGLVRDMENLQLNPDELEAFLNRAQGPNGNSFAQIVADAIGQGGAPQQPGAPRQPRGRGQQSPALPGFEDIVDSEAGREAARMLDRYQRSQMEWLNNAERRQSIVRIIVNEALGENRLARYGREDFINRLTERLREAEVPPAIARELAHEVWADKAAREATETARAQAGDENFEQRRAESILNRLQQDQTEWVGTRRQSEAARLIREFLREEASGVSAEARIERLSADLVRAGVRESTARELAFQAGERKAAVQASARIQAQSMTNDQAQSTADGILRRLQDRHSGVEWLRQDENVNQVREIVRQALQGRLGYAEGDTRIDPILQDPTPIVEKIQQALEAVGVDAETARNLGREIETERQNRWANQRVRQMERASRSNSVRSLIEDILNTPYRAQHDPVWRRRMAVRWFESNGLSNEQAEAAAELFNGAFEAAYRRAAERVAERVLRDGAPNTNEQFERLIRSGVLDPSQPWLDKFAEQSGWVKPTADQFAKIAELEEKLVDPELSPSEVADIIEQQRTILRHVGKKDGAGMRAMAEHFTASLLSQAVTVGRTFWVQFAPIFSLLKDFGTAVAFDPKNALNFAGALVNAYKNQAKNQIRFGWQKDAFQFHINDITGSHNELKRVYETTQKLIESPGTSKARKALARVQQIYALGRIVFKLMNTIDNTQMSIGREWKIVYYASRAFKDAGIESPQKISQLIDAMNAVRQSEFDRAIDAGLDVKTAAVRADHRATQAALDFVSGEAGGDYAMKVLQAAENDMYNVVGRLAPNIGTNDEGLISSYFMNPIMELASNLRKRGGVGNIVATVTVGMVNIPFRAARAASDFYGYGLIRYGIHKYRTNRGMETHWKQSFANELQAKHRRNVAIAGLALTVLSGLNALKNSSSDDDDPQNGVFVTGSGPKSKNLRDEWIKKGWSPYTLHIVINGVKIKIPLTRVGEPLFPPFLIAGVIDNVKWAEKEAKAKGKEINLVAVSAANFIAAQAQMLGARGFFQSVNQYGNLTEGGGAIEKNLARMLGGTAAALLIPFKSSLSQISEMILGPMDNSSASAIVANQFPIIGIPWQKPAVNRFGDAVFNQTLSGKFERLGVPVTIQIPSSSQNERLYNTLINKGIAPPELRRYVLEEKFGDLTDDQFSDFARKSGALLKQSAVSNLNDIQRMSPTEAKRFLQNAAERADKTAAAALGLERREKPQVATTTSPAASTPAPAASATSPASASTGGGGGSRASASGRIRKSLASFKVPRLKKVGGRIRSRISRGFKRIKAKTGRIRGRISYRRRMPRIRYAI